MKIQTVHRITGKHMLQDSVGAAIWLDKPPPKEMIERLQQGMVQLGWSQEDYLVHHHAHGCAVVVSSPPDQLYTACELLEWAAGKHDNFNTVLQEQQAERNIKLVELHRHANQNQWPVFTDEDGLTLGYGKHSVTYPLNDLPAISRLPQETPKRIPVAYITGTNGKTTTARMLAAIMRTSGFTDGLTSSDGVLVRGDWAVKGDWTGPGAARIVLRHPEVDCAILETARGGLMRRGLVIDDADCAAVTNVSADHLGYWGLYSSTDMANAKLTISLGVKRGGVLVLNADNEFLVATWEKWKYRRPDLDVQWFSSKRQGTDLAGCVVDNKVVLFGREIVSVEQIPLSVGGAAIHNIENAMAAALLAHQMGATDEQIALGLGALTATPDDSHGRTNVFQVRGATVFVDFAHNEDGLRRIVDMAKKIPAKRRLLVIGQAGDRGIELLHGFATAASKLNADVYYVKELPKHKYDACPKMVADQLVDGLLSGGISPDRILRFPDEVSAAKQALADIAPGDLLLLLSHEDYAEILALLAT